MRFKAGLSKFYRKYLLRSTPRFSQWALAKKHIDLIDLVTDSRVIKGISYGPKRHS